MAVTDLTGVIMKRFVMARPMRRGVLVGAGEEAAAGRAHALALDAQHHDGVGPRQRQGLVEVVGDLAGPVLHAHRQEGRRDDKGDAGAEGGQQVDVSSTLTV